jgi:hypothetical protein
VNVTAEREEAQRFPYLVAHKTLKRIELHERQRVRVTGHERAKSLKPSKGTATVTLVAAAREDCGKLRTFSAALRRLGDTTAMNNQLRTGAVILPF